MTIPLNLSVQISQSGIEIFGLLQEGLMSVGQTAATQTAAGLSKLSASLLAAIGGFGQVPIELDLVNVALSALSHYSGTVTPAALDVLANRLDALRVSLIQTRFPLLTLEEAEGKLTKRDWLLQNSIRGTSSALRTQSIALQTVGRTTVEAAQSTEKMTAATTKAATATRWMGREARLSALTGMNVLSSATQGVMLAMGLLHGSLMSVGFGLIFLRYSIAPITLGVAGLIAAIGGTIKAITFVGPAFEKLVTGPMNRMKAAVVEAIGYFSGAVWVRIIAPSLQILADLAERFRDLALQTWLSAEVQRSWGELLGMIQGTFQNLSRAIKEHGGILRWVVRTGFIAAINVLKGLIYLINVAIDVLPQLAYFWRRLSSDLKGAWATLGLVAQGLKDLGLSSALQRVKEFALDVTLEDMFRLALTFLTGGVPALLIDILTDILIEDLLGTFTTFDADVREKWEGVWKWVGTGALIGGWIGGVPGAIIGGFLGGIIGMFLNFRDELQTLGFDLAATMDRAFGPLIDVLLFVENALDRIGQGVFPEAMEESIRKWRESSAEFQRLHEIWRGVGRPVLEDWSGAWEDLGDAVKRAAEQTRLGIWAPQIGFTDARRLAEEQWQRGTTRWAPSEAYGAALAAGAQAAATIVNVTITGNNMYGKLTDEDARIWAQQIGFHTMSRLSTRRGIGVR